MSIVYIVARRCGTRTWCIFASTELPALLCLVSKQEKSSTTTLRLIEWLLILRYYIWGVICGAAVKWLWTTIVELQIFGYVFALSSVFQNQSNPVCLEIDVKTTFGILLFGNKYMYPHPREWTTQLAMLGGQEISNYVQYLSFSKIGQCQHYRK